MVVRPAVVSDIAAIDEIDGVIESVAYLHVEQTDTDGVFGWKLEQRPMREKAIRPNRPTEEAQFMLRQIVAGYEEGLAMVADHEQQVVALLLARARPERGTCEIIDLRVDYDHRRQGLATVLLFAAIEHARSSGLRAVSFVASADNTIAIDLLKKIGFDHTGLDTRRYTNHDLVKESASIFWQYVTDV